MLLVSMVQFSLLVVTSVIALIIITIVSAVIVRFAFWLSLSLLPFWFSLLVASGTVVQSVCTTKVFVVVFKTMAEQLDERAKTMKMTC